MIDTSGKLQELLPKVQQASWVAIDTEADSLHAYPEKLCLLQISIPDSDEMIDPLAGLDLAPFLKLLEGRELILHGADYDLRLLRRTFGFIPHQIFDTMWAARLLGYANFGLTDLVAKELGIQLEKGPQKMNWAQRPLPERMQRYARNDTRYLRPLSEILRAQLAQKNRLSWMEQICARLIEETSQPRVTNPDAIWRIKGSDRLSPAALAVLRELWAWREKEAIARNKPPYFVLSHEKLVLLSATASTGRPIHSLLPPHFSPERQSRLVAAVDRALRQPPSAHPDIRRNVGTRLTYQEQHRFNELRKLRDQRSADLQIDPTLIASRSTLVNLAKNWEANLDSLLPWQRQLLAPENGAGQNNP